ncbi:hypothetical protein GCM10010193_69840 [Kitasatospora atroaurantiaca]|uniref:Uncharacterized protein n=1 Tax=Kitasatospora atroaurantiaca TaxID=285545 RepID=A0A561EN79_9ACTN|nr:hypothetical protein [Kitasatospora atroaurantiaca]TWE17070.1 hypothetical protein FB465_2074 [Kitasatospora atroaurantiaca]
MSASAWVLLACAALLPICLLVAALCRTADDDGPAPETPLTDDEATQFAAITHQFEEPAA